MHMECFAMNLRRMIMATGTAALLAVATITTASAQGAQGLERARANAGASEPNLSTSGQVNAQGRAGTSGVNAQTRFQGSSRNQAQFQGSNRGEFQATNRSAMTNQRFSGHDRFANGRDRSRFARNARFSDRNRVASARFGDRGRFAATTTNAGRGGWNGGWGGWGWGPSVSVGFGGGWGWPGYDYGYANSGLYAYSPGFVGAGFGGGCSCNRGWWQ
jgi:hypothetical protein